MSDENKCIALDTAEPLQRLMKASRDFAAANPSYNLIPMDATRAMSFLYGQTISAINNLCVYVDDVPYEGLMRLAFFGNAERTPARRLANKIFNTFLYEDDVDEVCMMLSDNISQYIEDATYQNWAVHTTGRMILLTGGRDYRITEWEKLTNNTDASIRHNLTKLYQMIRDRITRSNAIETTVNVLINPLTLQRTVTTSYAPAPIRIGDAIDLDPIIKDSIRRNLSNISFVGNISRTDAMLILRPDIDESGEIDYSKLERLGVDNYENFYKFFIGPIIESFCQVQLRKVIKPNVQYYGKLVDGVLEVWPEDLLSTDPMENEILEDVQSLINGDYLPERNRRRAEEWLRANP